MVLLTKNLKRVGLIVKPSIKGPIISIPKRYIKKSSNRNYIRRLIKSQIVFMSLNNKLKITVTRDIQQKTEILFLLTCYCNSVIQSCNSSSLNKKT